MTCLEGQGCKSEALAVFERCRETLDAKLHISPSPDIEAMGKSLRLRKNI